MPNPHWTINEQLQRGLRKKPVDLSGVTVHVRYNLPAQTKVVLTGPADKNRLQAEDLLREKAMAMCAEVRALHPSAKDFEVQITFDDQELRDHIWTGLEEEVTAE